MREFQQIMEHGETRWDCGNISITKTKYGGYRVWNCDVTDTISVENTLAQAKAVGVKHLRIPTEHDKIKARIQILKENPKVRDLMRESIREITDQKLAEMTECPFCMTSFDLGWSEVDADQFCRVTCAGCEEYIEYNMSKVQVEKDFEYEANMIVHNLFNLKEWLEHEIETLDSDINHDHELGVDSSWNEGKRAGMSIAHNRLVQVGFEKKRGGS